MRKEVTVLVVDVGNFCRRLLQQQQLVSLQSHLDCKQEILDLPLIFWILAFFSRLALSETAEGFFFGANVFFALAALGSPLFGALVFFKSINKF
jgi:hypothetical protein